MKKHSPKAASHVRVVFAQTYADETYIFEAGHPYYLTVDEAKPFLTSGKCKEYGSTSEVK